MTKSSTQTASLNLGTVECFADPLFSVKLTLLPTEAEKSACYQLLLCSVGSRKQEPTLSPGDGDAIPKPLLGATSSAQQTWAQRNVRTDLSPQGCRSV